MQGRLLDKDLNSIVETECAISHRPIVFELDSDLRYSVLRPTERPLFFVPLIDLADLDAPCIVDDF